jgi:hypothetical protein
MRAVVSKRGVDDGNQKGGGSLQPAQESQIHYTSRTPKGKDFLKKVFDRIKEAGVDEKKIDIKVDEGVAVGLYSNLAAIRHSGEEFIFDFACLFPDGPSGKLLSRVILSPAHAKRFLGALASNVQGYEAEHGPIDPGAAPPVAGYTN